MDYGNPNCNRTFTLAVLRILATDKTNYKGPLFFNFGGPGASGTVSLYGSASQLRFVVGGAYDLVSWDPRGVGSTHPVVACYPDLAASERAEAKAKSRNENRTQAGYTDGLVDSLEIGDEVSRDRAARCDQHGRDLLPYVGTAAAARDMARLVDLYGHSNKLSYW